jgi:Flp pilus assembly protein TadG
MKEASVIRKLGKVGGQAGAIAVIMAAAMLVFLGFMGLVLDVGRLVVVKSDLQKAADAGARAGARALFFPANSSPPQCIQATATGAWIAQANTVDGAAATVSSIQTGSWNWLNRTFSSGCTTGSNYTTAVSLVATETINLPFMGLFGYGQVTLSAPATSSVGFLKGVPPGTIPVVIGKSAVVIGQQVAIYFTAQDNGGWFVPPGYSASAKNLRNFIAGTPAMPGLNVGDSINLNNGTINSALSDLKNQLNNHHGQWTSYLPVVDTDKFNQSKPIYGFVAFTLTAVNTGSHASIVGTISPIQEAKGPGYIFGGPALNIVGVARIVS